MLAAHAATNVTTTTDLNIASWRSSTCRFGGPSSRTRDRD
jgi:hypothetical protein